MTNKIKSCPQTRAQNNNHKDEYLLAFTGPPGAPESASIRRQDKKDPNRKS